MFEQLYNHSRDLKYFHQKEAETIFFVVFFFSIWFNVFYWHSKNTSNYLPLGFNYFFYNNFLKINEKP